MSNNVVLPVVRAFVLATKWGNHCLTPESGKRVQRSSAVSISTTTHPLRMWCTNEVDASKTPQKDRTRCAPLHRPPREQPLHMHVPSPHTQILMRTARHPSGAPSLKAIDVGDILLVFPWWRSVVCPSLKRNAPTAPDSAWVTSLHSLWPPSSWHALHNLIVLSIGNSCRSFRDARAFCRHTRGRFERAHGDADHPARNMIASCSVAEAQHNEAERKTHRGLPLSELSNLRACCLL